MTSEVKWLDAVASGPTLFLRSWNFEAVKTVKEEVPDPTDRSADSGVGSPRNFASAPNGL